MIGAIWHNLPTLAQDLLIAAGLLAPLVLIGVVMLRGFAPWPLVQALLWRYRWANGAFALLIALSLAIGLGLTAQERGLRIATAQAADKFDLIITAPGNETTAMLATVFLQPADLPLLQGQIFDEIAGHNQVAMAAPLAFGDSYQGAPIIGTTADFVWHLTNSQLEGRLFERPFEAVIGATSPLEIGETFTPSHGVGAAAQDDVHEDRIEVVGRMAATGSPWDRAVVTAVETVWLVHGLANGHAPDKDIDHIGPPFDPAYFPGTPAVIVRTDSIATSYGIQQAFDNRDETMAFFPGAVLSNLYRLMGDLRQAMSAMVLVSQILIALSVLLGLFIVTRLFHRQLALLRALGAPTRFILAVLWSYATVVLMAGGLLGLVFGFGASAVISQVLSAYIDLEGTASLGWPEFHTAVAFLSTSATLSLGMGVRAVSQPVLAGLRGQ